MAVTPDKVEFQLSVAKEATLDVKITNQAALKRPYQFLIEISSPVKDEETGLHCQSFQLTLKEALDLKAGIKRI